jgi:hypothetical protein
VTLEFLDRRDVMPLRHRIYESVTSRDSPARSSSLRSSWVVVGSSPP